MAQENREAYIAWLRDEIEKHCNSEGRYEAYWDYNDSITPTNSSTLWSTSRGMVMQVRSPIWK